MGDPVNVDEVIATLGAQFPAPNFELVPVEIRAGLFVLRNPSAAEHKMFRTQVLDDDTKGIATTNLFVSTCVYPDRQAVSAALARFPGILANQKIQRALAYLSGQTDTLEGKS